MAYVCEICALSFDKWQQKANHVRWEHTNNAEYAKKVIKQKATQFGEFRDYLVSCSREDCLKQFTVRERDKKYPSKEKYYCSRSCANARVFSKESKANISKAVRRKWKNGDYDHLAEDVIRRKIFSSKGERELRLYFTRKYPHFSFTFGRIAKNLNVDIVSHILKIIIEYDGVWHFKDIQGQLESKQKKDTELEEWCIKFGYKLIRIKEEIYLSNKKFWLQKIEIELFTNFKNKVIKFY